MRHKTCQAIVLAAILTLAASPAAADGPTLVSVEGAVEIGAGHPPVWHAAREGETLALGDAIRVGQGGRAELALGTGTLRLYENSVLRLPPDAFGQSGTKAVDLERGGSLFDIDKKSNKDGFEVRTPEAVVMVKGTRFSVALDGTTAAVSVFRGLVGVRSLVASLEHEVMVRPGFTAVGGPRDFELRLERQLDPWQSWGSGRPLPIPAPVHDGVEPPPAKIDVAEARAAAVREARREVARKLMRDNPELRRELAEQIAEAREQRRHDEDYEEGMLQMPSGDSSEPGSGEGPGGMTQPDGDLAEAIEDAIAEQLLNGGSGPGGCTSGCLTIEYQTSGGPNVVKFFVDGGFVGQLDEDQLENIIDNGNPGTIPAPVLNALLSSGLDPIQYMELIEDIYF